MSSIQGQLNLLTGTLFGSIGALGKGISKIGVKQPKVNVGEEYTPDIGSQPMNETFTANETQIPNAYAASVKAVESANEVIASKQNKKFNVQKRLSELKKEGGSNE